MRRKRSNRSGQTMVEYIIIVVIVAIAAIAIFGAFSDTIRQKLSGAVEELGGDTGDADVSSGSSHQFLQDLDASGSGSTP